MRTQRNVEHLFIGGTATKTTANYPSAMNAGEIGIFTPEGVRVTESTAATIDEFVVALVDSNGVEYVSPAYKKADIKSAKRLVYTAATQQVDYIGSNGTTGSIDAINNNLYKINIQVQELLRSNTDGRKTKFAVYTSDSSATQQEIAIGLGGSLVNNFDREPEKFIRTRVISDHALDTNDTMDETVTVTNGSNRISIATDYDYNTGTDLVVGDYIRIADSDTTVATTDDVYRIEEIVSTSNIRLDRKYQGTSGTRTHGNNSTQAIPAAEAASANWGISMTGVALGFVAGKENYEVASWETQLVDFGTTTENFKSTAATKGSGTVNQVAELEWFLQGNEGEYYRENFSVTHSPRSLVDASVTGGGYDLITITFDSSDTNAFQNVISPRVCTIATPATAPNYAITGTSDDITDVLEVLAFGSANGNLAL